MLYFDINVLNIYKCATGLTSKLIRRRSTIHIKWWLKKDITPYWKILIPPTNIFLIRSNQFHHLTNKTEYVWILEKLFTGFHGSKRIDAFNKRGNNTNNGFETFSRKEVPQCCLDCEGTLYIVAYNNDINNYYNYDAFNILLWTIVLDRPY